MRKWLGVTAGCLMLIATAARGENWPQFRGPTGLGYTLEKNLPVRWGGEGHENVRWKSPLVGQGHASPIVWGDRVLVCTARWPDSVQQKEKVIPEHHVLGYDARHGGLLWDTQIPPGPWLRTDFRSGPGGGYACPTPATDGRMIYAAFGSSVLAAVDMEGRLVWRKDIIPYTFDVTLGSSPVVYRDTVLLVCAMAKTDDSRILAFDKASGAIRWEKKFHSAGFAHSTPVIVPVEGKDQMIFPASGMGVADDGLQSFDPGTGQRLWWCRGGGDAASIAFAAGLVYFDSGRGGPGTAVAANGQGDVSATHIRWTVPRVPEGIGSPILVGPQVYRIHSPGILRCWNTADGRERYAQRLDGLFSTWASPVADPGGRLFFATAGKSYVIQAGPEFRVLGVNDLGDGNHASPAVSGGCLYLAGMKNLYCIGQRP